MRTEALDRLAAAYPDCKIAAFADISVGITLRTSSKTNAPQEVLDELCAEAGRTLALASESSPFAIKADQGCVTVFMRSADNDNDALILKCDDSLALDAIIDDAFECLEDAA